MSRLIVAKFGGTSMATGHSFRLVADRVLANLDTRVVVVSAPGRINDLNDPGRRYDRSLPKVTDALLELTSASGRTVNETSRAVIERFACIARDLGLEGVELGLGMELGSSLERRMQTCREYGDPAPLAALGEEVNAKLFAAYLRTRGVDAVYADPSDISFIVDVERSSGRTSIADAQYASIRSGVVGLLDSHHLLVVPGFFGHDETGGIRTFSRGGSDYTGAILAAALDAKRYQNWTDTDGISVVEPSVAKNAPVLATMTHRAMLELTMGGSFGVLQHDSIVPLASAGIPTSVRSTFYPSSEGTLINGVPDPHYPVAGIVHRGEFVAFDILKYGMANQVGVFVSLLGLFETAGISVEHSLTSTNSITVIVRKSNLKDRTIELSQIEQNLPGSTVTRNDRSAVAIVGEGISDAIGLGARIFGAVARAGIKVINMSHTDITTMLWFRNGDAERAARAIYEELFEVGGRN